MRLKKELYFVTSTVVDWVGNPIDFIDPTGMDYWHTDDPDQIASFLEQIENGGFDNANLAGWHHSTDDDFLANLSYNDQTGSFLYSYGAIVGSWFGTQIVDYIYDK